MGQYQHKLLSCVASWTPFWTAFTKVGERQGIGRLGMLVVSELNALMRGK